jgi:D-3-phosphoglycerate dehydrogenase / 2-oxoglutarate reductase
MDEAITSPFVILRRTMKTVLLSAPYMLPLVDRFTPVFKHYGIDLILPEVHERLSEAELLQYAGQFDGAICGDDRYTPRVIEACKPRLKVISKWGTGIDSINQTAAARSGILVKRTTNAFTFPVSDTVMGYILAFARRQPWMDQKMKRGEWNKIEGRALHECTLGVVGVGNIGKMIFKKASAFEMKLLGTDIIEIDPDFISTYGVEMTSLEDLLSRSDFISINADLNPTSFHLMNTEHFNQVKPGSVLINTARGPIVEETALIAALESGRLGGAALDVFEVEPLPLDSPLLKMEQVLLAPHNSNSSPEAWEKVHWNTIKNLLEGLNIPCQDLAQFQNGEEKDV